jgi:acylaminoacyl-peptidase
VTKGFDGDTPSKPFGDESEFTFTPAGDAIVFSARVAGKSEPWSTNFDLWRTNGLSGDGRFTNLTDDNEAWDTGPVFSPDGRTMAYRAMVRPGFEADRYAILLKDVATGQTREIAANWDRSADGLKWSADEAGRLAELPGSGHACLRRAMMVVRRVGSVSPAKSAIA